MKGSPNKQTTDSKTPDFQTSNNTSLKLKQRFSKQDASDTLKKTAFVCRKERNKSQSQEVRTHEEELSQSCPTLDSVRRHQQIGR